MKRIKATSKRGRYYYNRYSYSCAYSILDIYKKPSQSKVEAERDCHDMMAAEGGWHYKVISHTAQTFTVTWKTAEGLRVETASNSYIVK